MHLIATIALALAPQAQAQSEYPPLPVRGAWTYDFLADNFGGHDDAKPKACTGQHPVIDLDAPKVQGVAEGKYIRYVYAALGPRDGSKPVVWQVFEHRYVTGAVKNVSLTRFEPVPDTIGPKGAALIKQLSDPKTKAAALETVRARFVAAGGGKGKAHRVCQK